MLILSFTPTRESAMLQMSTTDADIYFFDFLLTPRFTFPSLLFSVAMRSLMFFADWLMPLVAIASLRFFAVSLIDPGP